jgi:glycosyltransferase involved in cell wall biosynthesis
LDNSFQALGPTRVIRPQKMKFIHRMWSKLHYISFVNYRLKSLVEEPVGLIYQNTIGKGLLLTFLKRKMDCPVVTHIHELEGVIRSSGVSNIRRIKAATNHFIAASEAVKQNLIENHQIPDQKISIHYECIESIPDRTETIQPVLPIKIGESDFVIGSAGFVDYRKGFDIFLEVAKSLIKRYQQNHFKFIWVGEFGRNKQKAVENFIKRNSLEQYVCFLGEKQDPFPVFRMYDLFFLSSREDPFPLVMLESAFLGIPVVGFKGTGGVDEFLGQLPELLLKEWAVPYVVDQIIQFSKDRKKLKEYGIFLKNKVRENHQIKNCARKYLDNIKYLAGI